VKKVADRLLVFEDGTTNLYRFGYDEYQEKLDREAEEAASYKNTPALGGAISQNGAAYGTPKAPESAAAGEAPANTAKGYYNPGKERSRLEKKVQRAEEELALKEEKLAELKEELLRPEYQSSYSKLTEIQKEIDAMEEAVLADMEVWEELSSQLDALTS
jgi:ATP-binding cassette subfamily F protein 3